MALDTLDLTLSRILFHKPDKFDPAGVPYLIGRTASGQTVKGRMRRPREGERYRLWGSWEAQKGYAEPAFEFVSHEVLMDEGVAGVAQYLRNYVDGLGVVKAAALVEALGDDTLLVLRTDPDRALAVPGITPTIVAKIRDHFAEDVTIDPAAYARLVDLFAGHKFPRKVVLSLLKDWGSDAPQKVIERPYMLLAYPRMGWKGVDAFALDPKGAAYDPDGLDRQVAAIVEGLGRLADDGHTYGTRVEVEAKVFALIGRRPEDLAWHVATIDRQVIRLNDGPAGEDDASWLADERPDDADEAFALLRLAYAEKEVADHLRRLMEAGGRLPFSLRCAGLGDRPEAEEQRAAVKIIEENPLSILAGPPGTGKTYVVSQVVKELIGRGVRSIRCVAPTGKASKRISELLSNAGIDTEQVPCSTIHKALGVGKSDEPEGASAGTAKVGRGRDAFGFRHNEDNPLEVDFLVVDECSMIDVRLMASLLAALATGTRVVLVGDPNQLPSVGPGSVLRDLLAAGVPAATLATIQRSDGGGRVVKACHAIKDGKVPQPAPRMALPTENWVHIEEDDPGRIAEIIVELHEGARKNGRYDPLWDLQVVSAQKEKLAFACGPLNLALARVLNPAAWAPSGGGENEPPGPPFRVGDKVIRRKNGSVDEMIPLRGGGGGGNAPGRDWPAISKYDHAFDPDPPREDWRWLDPRDPDVGEYALARPYALRETAIVNGDVGQVVDIVVDADAGQAFAVVRFRNPDRLCRLPMGEHHLQLAYAMTCHSAQGSGMPYVIVPVHHSFHWDQRANTGLWCRELVYTAISRAEKLLVTVGQRSAIEAAVRRRTIGHRRTRLAGLLGGVAGRTGVAR